MCGVWCMVRVYGVCGVCVCCHSKVFVNSPCSHRRSNVMSKDEAEATLQGLPAGTFLVRLGNVAIAHLLCTFMLSLCETRINAQIFFVSFPTGMSFFTNTLRLLQKGSSPHDISALLHNGTLPSLSVLQQLLLLLVVIVTVVSSSLLLFV